MMTDLLFYIFSIFAVLSCVMVILSSQAVYSILYLIFAYINVSALFIMIGADFSAMILMVVYVGAVAVLFLFIVMMLDTNLGSIKNVLHQHFPMIIFLVAMMILVLMTAYFHINHFDSSIFKNFKPYEGELIKDIGRVLYTDYFLYFQLSAMILLLAMIGAIALTLRTRPGVKRQNIHEQVSRDSHIAVENISIKPGSPLEDNI